MKSIKSKMNTLMLVMVSLLLITSCSNDDNNTPTPPELPENMVDVGGGIILEQSKLSPHLLAKELTIILSDPEQLKNMAQNAKKLSMQNAVEKLALVAQDAANEEE